MPDCWLRTFDARMVKLGCPPLARGIPVTLIAGVQPCELTCATQYRLHVPVHDKAPDVVLYWRVGTGVGLSAPSGAGVGRSA